MGRRTATLDEVLAYRNQDVLARFCKTWRMARPQASRVFADLMRYLWLASSDEPMAPVPIIDEMWHAFLVYTREYREFCDRYFGRMIHHAPTPLAEQRAWRRLLRRSPARARARMERELERELAFVTEQLGARVMLRWYVAYTEKYDARFFKRAFYPGNFGGRFPPELRARAKLA